jgi:hypothetical protein
VSSFTATSAPSLRPARPERFPSNFPVSSDYSIHTKFLPYLSLSHTHTVWAVTPGVASALTFAQLLPRTRLFPFRRGLSPPQGPFPDSSQSAGSSDYLFRDPSSENLI